MLCQQMASSNPSAGVTVNILLLVLSFFSYVRLLRGARGEKCRKICSDCCGRLCHTYGICVQSLRGRDPHPFEQHGDLYEQSMRYVGTGNSCPQNFAVDAGGVVVSGWARDKTCT